MVMRSVVVYLIHQRDNIDKMITLDIHDKNDFEWLAKVSRAGVAEMLRTFNCGIGMVLICAASEADGVCAMLRANGEAPCVLGKLEAAPPGGGEQVVVDGTAVWGW